MSKNEDLILYRILSGRHRFFLDNEVLYITQPTPYHHYLAEELYVDTIERCGFDNILSDDEMLLKMQDIGLWKAEEEQELNLLPKQIENTKCDLYDDYVRMRDIKEHRKRLEFFRKRLSLLSDRRNAILANTSDSLASASKVQFLACACTQTHDMRYKWTIDEIDNIAYNVVLRIVAAYNAMYFPEKTIRHLARNNNGWRTIWVSRKSCSSIFDVPATMLTDMQRQLVSWSSFYDAIHENPDCPTDEVINDDDLLDGWTISQSRERSQDKATRQGENKLSNKNIANSSEIFYVVGEDMDRARRISEMNSAEARLSKRRKVQLVTTHGQIPEEKMPESQLQMKMQAHEAYRQKVKGMTHGQQS